MGQLSELLLTEIKKVMGSEDRLLLNEADLYSYAFDASFGTYRPELVLQPVSTTEVVNIVRLANQYQIPLYPRGSGTSLSGGPLPVYGGIVLDFTRWDDLLMIHREDLVAIVSPGVITANINEKANEYGLMYPPDPSSAHVATIAGNLAENSGGPRGLKYGVTKDYVIGLQVVTPEGEIIQTGGRTVKNVTGYDLTKLIIGSEGTLGIITEATLRLIPKPVASQTMMVLFDDFVVSGRLISNILSSGILPAKMEIMDQSSIMAVEEYEPLGLPTDMEAIILIELDGHPYAIEAEMKKIKKICLEIGAKNFIIAENDEHAMELWKARKLVSPAIVRKKPTKISEDATVPRSKIPEMFKKLKEGKKG